MGRTRSGGFTLLASKSLSRLQRVVSRRLHATPFAVRGLVLAKPAPFNAAAKKANAVSVPKILIGEADTIDGICFSLITRNGCTGLGLCSRSRAPEKAPRFLTCSSGPQCGVPALSGALWRTASRLPSCAIPRGAREETMNRIARRIHTISRIGAGILRPVAAIRRHLHSLRWRREMLRALRRRQRN